jgi:hypothetical protein
VVPRQEWRRGLAASAWTAALALLAVSFASISANAEPVHIRLRGAARIEAQGVRGDGGDLIVRGTLTDDAGAPLAAAALAISIARGSSPAVQVVVPGGGGARGCGADSHAPRVLSDGVHLATDGGGRFCIRVSVPVDTYIAHIAYAGDGYVDSGAADVQVDLSRRTCTLAFTPPPRVILLDATSISLVASATFEGETVGTAGAGLALTLRSERGAAPIATATTDVTGHARFKLSPSLLGPVGRGELRLEFAGNGDAPAALRVVEIERRAEVELDVPEGHPDAQGARLPAGSPEEGVSFVVEAHATGGEVQSGSVEARIGVAVVGAAPVESGKADLLVTFGLPESVGASGEIAITLRYVPSAPWYVATGESTWRLPVRGRSPLRQGWVLLGALAVAGWFIIARAQRAKAMAKAPPRPRVSVARGEAKLDVVRLARNPGDGWKGRVTDADDATGVTGARVQIERPAFGRAEVLGTALTDEEGRFTLMGGETRPGDELAVEASLHVPLRRPLPHAGELDVQLVQRKRAMLGRLVTWAKLRGRPFDARPEPTPGHVRRAAGEDFALARWADAVERAAFAGEPVDARVEAEVDRLAPGSTAPAPEARPIIDRRALANPTKPNR